MQRNHMWILMTLLASIIIATCVLCSLIAAAASTAMKPGVANTLPTQPTQAPTDDTLTPTIVSTLTPDKAYPSATPYQRLPTPTHTPVSKHNPPRLDGMLADFIGKYGKPAHTNGSGAFWVLRVNGVLILDVRSTEGGRINYIEVSTRESWSQGKIHAYCLSFAPTDYRLTSSSGSDYVYDSQNGKFALHMQGASCWMNML